MSIKCSLFLAIILLFFPQIGFSTDFYAMGCKPTEKPRQEASKVAEEASPEMARQPSRRDISTDQKFGQHKVSRNKYRSKSEGFEQIATFRLKKNAERHVRKLEKGGYESVIRKGITKNKRTVYRVFVKKINGTREGTEAEKSSIPDLPLGEERISMPKKESIDSLSSRVLRKEIAEEKSDKPVESEEFSEKARASSRDFLSKDTLSEKPSEEKPVDSKRLPVATAEQKEGISGSGDDKLIFATEKPLAGETPLGSVTKRPAEDVFGKRGGFIHPFLSVTEYYTDNVFYSNKDKESDFITVLSPGIWLTVPHVHEKLLEIDTSNISPGGYGLKRYQPETFRRYQTYLFYNADIESFAKHSSENAVNHKAEGLFQYNLRGGLSATVLDQFIASHDDRGTGISDRLDRFRTNLANVVLTYDVSRRFSIRGDYSNFIVNYTAKRNNFRDRNDNAVSGYVFYKIRPRTSLFVEYEYLDVRYKKDIQSDSKEHHYYGGIQWDITAKSRGTIKAGYGIKDFTDSETGNSDDLILEAQIDHKFTPKTSLILRASRQTNETNVSGFDFILTDTVELEYLQGLTGKITADIKLLYEKDDYEGDSAIVGERLVDRYYSGAFAFRYQFREWMGFDLGYIYMQRDSNDNDFDYDTNVVFLRITGAL